MNGIVILRNNPEDVEAKDIDRTKGFLKPYTLTFLASLIVILFLIKLKIFLALLFTINVILDLRAKV
jgi:hypothetical protein